MTWSGRNLLSSETACISCQPVCKKQAGERRSVVNRSLENLGLALLRQLESERAHGLALKAVNMGLAPLPGPVQSPRLATRVANLELPNPVGLAAGFDKDAVLAHKWANVGFGFVEVGTVTPRPQIGNPKPRLFRLPKDGAVINRMGFNNGGVFDAVNRLDKEHRVLVGGNIGKNKVTPNEKAILDYMICFEALFDYVDYFVVNVSSPNTPGLRELQDKEPLELLLRKLKTQGERFAERKGIAPKPILLKIPAL